MAYTFGQASKGTTQEENKNVQQSGYVFGQASKNTQNPVVQEEETPGFVQGVAQAAAKPFLGFASQGRDIATEAANLPRVIKGEKPVAPKGEYDYGYFGKVKSFGEMTPDKAGVKAAISGVGAGLGAASFLPIGGALSTIGKGVVTRTLPSAKILAAEGASAGFLQGLGSATQDKKGLKETAEETTISTIGGGVLGPVVGKTVGGVSKAIGDQVVKLTQPLETHKARVAQNIHRALSTQGKKSIGVSLKTPEKQYRAFEVLRDLAPNIDVIDNATGETIKWEPKTTDFQQFGQALAKGKETVWKGVTNAVKEATGKDLQVDILPIVDDMNKIAGDPFRTPEVRRAAQLYSEQLVQMSDVTGKAPLEGVMTFNKDLNTKIGGVLSGTTDNVVRDLEAGLAKKLSENTDNAVETIAGKEFAKLKDDYSALKTIEKDAVRRMQQELRMTDNSLGDMVGRYGNIEIVNGLIQATQGQIGPLAKGVGLKIMGAYTKKLRQPSTYLQKAFREIDRYKSGEGFENAASRGVQTVKDTLKKNPKGMIDFGAEVLPKKATLPTYRETGNLTTKILKDLEGKTTVSKQYILDATNRGELKQQERDIVRQMLDGEGDTVNVADFAKKVQTELLPLTSRNTYNNKIATRGGVFEEGQKLARYETITLPDEIRGKVMDYSERIYESPIKTSAGNIHFGVLSGNKNEIKNYFGHTRIEDMADNQTRRVIEVQSDLYQKGMLEKAVGVKDVEYKELFNKYADELGDPVKAMEKATKELANKNRSGDVAKLQQYSNPTAHFRMVREEIKKAADDGKTKLQFPTGETAMKIEGLGEPSGIWRDEKFNEITPQKLEVGKSVFLEGGDEDRWIITDVLGDGKFKAMPKSEFNKVSISTHGVTKSDALLNPGILDGYSEQFDISGKVDTNNPIYRFYEKDLGRYLTSKYGAKIVTDDKGVNWYEVAIDKKKHGAPVEAFGVAGLAVLGTANQKVGAAQKEEYDWEAKTTEVKSRYGLPSGKTIFERKKITHPDNLSKFEELYNKKIPNDVKKVIDAIAYNESVDGKYRVNKGDQKDKSDSVGLLHMGKDAVAEFNKRKEYFGYTGPDINIKDLTSEEADIIQKFIQASRIVRDMNVNKRNILDATTFIQNPGEKNYGEKVMKKIKSKL